MVHLLILKYGQSELEEETLSLILKNIRQIYGDVKSKKNRATFGLPESNVLTFDPCQGRQLLDVLLEVP